MGDNIGKIMYWPLSYNADSLTTLYHALDPNHSIVSGFQCDWLKGHGSFPVGTNSWLKEIF